MIGISTTDLQPQIAVDAVVPIHELYTADYDYLTPEEWKILLFMSVGGDRKNFHTPTRYTFQGIKRKTQLHPQKATKAIKRLLEKGLVDHEDKDYLVTTGGTKLVSKVLKYFHPEILFPEGVFSRSWASFSASDAVELDELVRRLKGKWAGNLRFVSISRNENEVVFDWIDSTGNVHAAVLVAGGHFIELAVVSPKQETSNYYRDQIIEWLRQAFGSNASLMLLQAGAEDHFDFSSNAEDRLRPYYK